MTSTDQIIANYLEQLERNLGGRAGERGEILSEIESHIHTRLSEIGTERPSTEQTLSVIKELGSPEAIAQEFYSTSEGSTQAGVLDPQPSNTGKIVFFVALGIVALMALPLAMPLLTSMLWSVF